MAHFMTLPMIVTPAFTCIPSSTKSSTDPGIVKSVREPNFIIPKRSPHSTLSPARFQQTIRRARIPAICVHLTVNSWLRMVSVFCSFSMRARALVAIRNLPRLYATSTISPAMGERFTCTSSGERKILTNDSASRLPARLTSVTLPSAGATIIPFSVGTWRFGSRKKNPMYTLTPTRPNETGQKPKTAGATAHISGATTYGIPSRTMARQNPSYQSGPSEENGAQQLICRPRHSQIEISQGHQLLTISAQYYSSSFHAEASMNTFDLLWPASFS